MAARPCSPLDTFSMMVFARLKPSAKAGLAEKTLMAGART
ncbi:hypothetical protein ACZ87_00919 [Candidatus Erwinia dacicola]|uniref:Uncharacterized protein n=1 Tax=Candidatus Erwinia dacicola TaxID=252393 RepID=A0A328TTX8_9GAMM|nr:hypothetical protein ACZ87_00919 [Candidatus Erwinia dacicola]